MLRLAEGVILNLIITTSPFLPIILLRVTPTANRNSYRVARLVGRLPRVACFARNPGLGKRNSYRVAAACGLLSIISPHAAATCEGMPLYHCTIFTINIWMGGEIGTAIIIIMIYYKKTAHHFAQIEIMAIFAHHHLYLCHNH